MYHRSLIIVALIAAVSGQEKSTVNFGRNASSLSECILSHQLFNCDENYESTDLVKDLAESIAKKYSGKTVPRDNIDAELYPMIFDLRRLQRNVPWDFVEFAAKEALMDCSDDNSQTPHKCPKYLYQFFEKFLSNLFKAWTGQTYHYELFFK